MKIMTFNILTGGTDEYGSRIDFIKEAISEVSPDFVALQEANDFQKDNRRLLREVSQHIGLRYYTLSTGSMREGRQYHLASLSRYPFKKKYVHSQAPFSIEAPISTVIDSPLGELSICNLHLDAWSENKRLKELEIILRDESEYRNQILLGDFNSVSSSDNYDVERLEVEARFDVTDILRRDYVDVASYLGLEDRSTFPAQANKSLAFTRDIRIDYIFVAASLAARIKGASMLKTPTTDQASDHYPLVVTIE